MQHVVLAVILHEGRVVVEQLTEAVRPEFRGVPTVLPGGHAKSGELPEEAIKHKVLADIGISVHVEGKIAHREHPLLPESYFVYFHCTVVGSPELVNKNQNKAVLLEWVDINTAAVRMLTLYSRVLAFMIRHVYGATLPQGSTLPELAWLAQDFELFGEKVRNGKLVAFPTETVYGLGANALDTTAVSKIFKAKNRPADNPLIVHVPSLEAVERVVATIDELSRKLLEYFTPGPMTVLLPKSNSIDSLVTAGSPLVGVRIPANLFTLEFLSAAKVPVAAPSANKSGKPSATHHQHVIDAFGKEVPNVIKAGSTFIGLESTVVLPKNNEQLVILRQGALSPEQLQKAFPKCEVIVATKNDTVNAPSPGIRHRHYAPKGAVTVVPLSTKGKLLAQLRQQYRRAVKAKEAVVILCSLETQARLPKSYNTISLGSETDLGSIARNLYSVLLECDAKRFTRIITQSFPEIGPGQAVMERIHRAAEAP